MKKLFYLVIKCRNQQLTIKNYLAHVQSMQVNNQINIKLLLNKQKKGWFAGTKVQLGMWHARWVGGRNGQYTQSMF